MTGVIIRGGAFGNMETPKEESHMRAAAEIGVICLRPSNTKDCRQPPEAKREAWIQFCLRASRRNEPCCHLDSGLNSLQNYETIISVVLSLLVCDNLFRKPEETNTYQKMRSLGQGQCRFIHLHLTPNRCITYNRCFGDCLLVCLTFSLSQHESLSVCVFVSMCVIYTHYFSLDKLFESNCKHHEWYVIPKSLSMHFLRTMAFSHITRKLLANLRNVTSIQ